MREKFDSIVNKTEANALKEMIFRRARERSQSMTEEFQADTMDMARDSFVSDDNPFSRIASQSQNNAVPKDTSATQKEPKESYGFQIREQKSRISTQSRLIDEQMANAAIVDTMLEARAGLSNKQSFMGALNFLNSQAAISLMRTRVDKFEVVA